MKSYLSLLCKDCKGDLNKPPALPRLCKYCNGSLYHLTVDLLTEYFPRKVPNSFTLFLLYEYKAHILILIMACNEIRKGYCELMMKILLFFESLRQRVRRLEDLDASLEPKIPEYVFFVLPVALPKDAERAINLAIEAENGT